jgi:hypothetical protein
MSEGKRKTHKSWGLFEWKVCKNAAGQRRPRPAVAIRNVMLHNFGISQVRGVIPAARFSSKKLQIPIGAGEIFNFKSQMLPATPA